MENIDRPFEDDIPILHSVSLLKHCSGDRTELCLKTGAAFLETVNIHTANSYIYW